MKFSSSAVGRRERRQTITLVCVRRGPWTWPTCWVRTLLPVVRWRRFGWLGNDVSDGMWSEAPRKWASASARNKRTRHPWQGCAIQLVLSKGDPTSGASCRTSARRWRRLGASTTHYGTWWLCVEHRRQCPRLKTYFETFDGWWARCCWSQLGWKTRTTTAHLGVTSWSGGVRALAVTQTQRWRSGWSSGRRWASPRRLSQVGFSPRHRARRTSRWRSLTP